MKTPHLHRTTSSPSRISLWLRLQGIDLSSPALDRRASHWKRALAAGAALVLGASGSARAALRPGAARVLAIGLAPELGAGLERGAASSTQARACNLGPGLSWGGRSVAGSPGVFFTREENGERGIWLALAARNPEAGGSGAASDGAWAGRGLKWSARPVLKLRAPLQCSSPVPLDGGRLLLLCTNATELDGALEAAAANRGVSEGRRVGRSERGGHTRIVWLEPRTNRWGFLSPPDVDSYDPCVSPDGRRLAFTSMRAGREAVFTLALEPGFNGAISLEREPNRESGRLGSLRLAAPLARGARWMDAGTLIFESTSARGGRGRTALGLFVVALAADGAPQEPRLLLARAREVAVAPNGRALCAVVGATEAAPDAFASAGSSRRRDKEGSSEPQPSTLLVMTAPDGSGARLLQDTSGARRPSFASDGRAVLFDAPGRSDAESGDGSEESARSLWSVPLLRTPPVATLSNVAPLSTLPHSQKTSSSHVGGASDEQALAVVGTAFSPEWGPLSARVEVGEGESPSTWTLLSERNSAAQNEVLAHWKPSEHARGDWTLRLSVRDAAGDEAQSLLPVTLPLLMPLSPAAMPSLPAPVPGPENSTIASSNASNSHGAHRGRMAVVEAPTPRPSSARNPGPRNPSRSVNPPARSGAHGGRVSMLPLPALPPAPESTAVSGASGSPSMASSTAASSSTDSSTEGAPGTAAGETPRRRHRRRRPRVERAPEDASPALAPPPLASDRRSSTSRTRSSERPTDNSRTDNSEGSNSGTSEGGGSDGRDAEIEVSGLPRHMKAGQTVSVTVRWVNRSRFLWHAAGEDDGSVLRLAYRFLVYNSGTRRRWAYAWLRTDTAPQASGEQVVNITAPPPGRYRLRFGLVRIPKSGFTPPSSEDAGAQRHWPGEIAQSVYSVEVSP